MDTVPTDLVAPSRRSRSPCIARIILFAMIVAGPCAPAWADDLFDHPRTAAQASDLLRAAMPGLGEVQVLRGRYTQRKFLREIPRPLSSSGEFLLVRDRGIWWHTQAPLEAEVTLTAGQTDPRATAAATLFALFALDLDALARTFDLFLVASGPHWLLGLRPRDASLAAWLTQVTIGGGGRVERVSLVEAAGDRTEIDLEATPEPLSSLTPVDRRHLEH